jgi:hypothetical protein
MTTPQTQAVQVANGLIICAQQFMNLYQQMVALDAQWTDQGVATILAAMSTSAQNADGSIGTADGSPNVAHPITSTLLSRAISSNQIGQMKTVLDGLVTYINGSAVTTQAGARAILNVAVGG